MKNEVWGYARVSTKEQNLARQIEQLKEFGISERNIKCDKISGKTFNRMEYNIMAFLSVHAGKVLTYAAIIRAVWGYSDYGSVKKLQVNMKNIRKKMGVTPGEKRYIINELGVGYRMLAEDEA